MATGGSSAELKPWAHMGQGAQGPGSGPGPAAQDGLRAAEEVRFGSRPEPGAHGHQALVRVHRTGPG